MTGPIVARADHLSVRYRRVTALREIAFRVDPGLTALLGPNGAGKTTLLRVLATLQSFEGDVEIEGQDPGVARGRTAIRRITGYLPQSVPFNRGFTLADTVAYAGWLKGLSGGDLRDRVGTALSRVNLQHLEAKRASRLSGGQRRRMGIAAAIVAEPSLLLLDEPTAGLDPVERTSLLRLLRELSTTTAVIYSTHLADEVAYSADAVMVVDGGILRWNGRVRDLIGGEPTPESVSASYTRLVADTEQT